ncbi:MAG: hypothetical protein FWD90_13490 [Defluviitaleaceae bacterium]|nr:hypothetical protein [Defluviitaleaceae bacterium]
MNIPNILSNQEVTDLTEAMKDTDPRSNGPRPGAQPVPPTPPTAKPVINELLMRIDAIVMNTAHINEAVNAIKDMAGTGELCEETAGTIINGVVDVVKAREHTNQSAINLLKEMYNDAKPAKSGKNIAQDLMGLGHLGLDIDGMVSSLPPSEKLSFLREVLGMDA